MDNDTTLLIAVLICSLIFSTHIYLQLKRIQKKLEATQKELKEANLWLTIKGRDRC